MSEYYLIMSVQLGYWDKLENRFRGINWATKYVDEVTANHFAKEMASKVEPCYVVKIFDNKKN